MTDLTYHLYDVFTDRPFCGNPLAVFLGAEGLSSETMGRIAKELNLSETVFVSAVGSSSSFALRIFTPLAELPFAGHPTIGAACALRDARLAADEVKFDMSAGEVVVAIDGNGARFAGPVQASAIEVAFGRAAAGRLLGVDDDEVLDVTGAEAGVPFVLIEVASREALQNCAVSLGIWRNAWAQSSTPHIYAYYRRTNQDIHARMFAPAMGIAEDPATGGAAAALAAVLPDGAYSISQGEDLGRPSAIELRVTGRQPIIGGEAIRIGGGRLSEMVLASE